MAFEGTWDVTIESSIGVRRARLSVDQRDDQIAGSMVDESGPTDVSGRVDGDDVEFVAATPGMSGPLVMTFFGRVEGDEVLGSVDFGEAGGGTWTARRL